MADNRLFLVATAAAPLALFAGSAAAETSAPGYGPWPGMMGYGWAGMGWMMLFGGFLWILAIVLVVAALIWFVRSPPHLHHPLGRAPGWSALDLLEERYARGEIQRDEYLQKKRDILGRGTGG